MKCKLCEEKFDTLYRIPRNLICGHTFCEQCLKIYTKNEEINCPKCMKISQSQNLPICYAIYEMLEYDNNHKKNDICFYHSLEKTQFFCKEDNINICLLCYLNDHRDHSVVSVKENNFVEETKKEFDHKMRVLKEKCDYMYLIKNEIEKCEEFIEKMNEKQLKKLDSIHDNIIYNKKEKIENYEKQIELNFLLQKDNLNRILNKVEYKQQIIEIYSNQINELLKNFNKSKSELSSYNITKSEDEFKRIRDEFEGMIIDKKFKIENYSFDLCSDKLLKDQFIKYNYKNNVFEDFLKNSNLSNMNSVIFIGDSKDNFIFKYDLVDNLYTNLSLETCLYNSQNQRENDYSLNFNMLNESKNELVFLDYMSSCLFQNGNILLSGGCIYSSYKTTASKQTYILNLKEDKITFKIFKPMLVKRFSHGSVVIKDLAYVFGGHDGNETLSSLEYFDKNESKWKFLQFMNVEREIFAFCQFRNRFIYVFGGFNVNHLDTIERYDTINDSWKLLSIKLKRPMQNPTAVEIDNNKICLIGGYNGALHKCVDILYVNEKKWISIDNMLVPRRRAHCYLFNNKVHIFGGESSESEIHYPEVYNLINNKWDKLNSFDHIISKSLNFWTSVALNSLKE